MDPAAEGEGHPDPRPGAPEGVGRERPASSEGHGLRPVGEALDGPGEDAGDRGRDEAGPEAADRRRRRLAPARRVTRALRLVVGALAVLRARGLLRGGGDAHRALDAETAAADPGAAGID